MSERILEFLGGLTVDGLIIDRALNGDVAMFSPDRRYRYVLTRNLGGGLRVLVVVGLNPSTADAFRDDNTIRRLIARARALGCGLLVMLNAFAWRATKPSDMVRASVEMRASEMTIAQFRARNGRDPRVGEFVVGERNDEILETMLRYVAVAPGSIALAGWGTHVPAWRLEELSAIAGRAHVEWMCLGYNEGGSPRHPLYVASADPLVPWPRPAEPDAYADIHAGDAVRMGAPMRGVVDVPGGVERVNIQPIEIHTDDPDRFAQGLVDAFAQRCTCGSTSGLRGNHHRAGCPRAGQ